MIRLILHEKKNDMRNEIINIVLFTSFMTVAYIISNLMVNINKISKSEWFDGVQRAVSEQNIFIKEQVDTLKASIFSYGIIAIIIIIAMFAIVVKNSMEKYDEKIWLLHAMGYSKKQTLSYCMRGYGMDICIVLIITVAIVVLFNGYINEATGIEKIANKAGMELGNNYLIMLILIFIETLYMAVSYLKMIKNRKYNKI